VPGQQAAPRPAMTSFRLPACATGERGGGPGTFIGDVGEERQPRTTWRGSGRSMTACSASLYGRKDEPFIFYNSCPGPSTCTWRELETGPYNTAESELRPHDWSVLSPTAVHQDKRTTSWHTGPFAGAYVGLEGGVRTWRLNTGPPMGSRK
jgi:hypothetical protein